MTRRVPVTQLSYELLSLLAPGGTVFEEELASHWARSTGALSAMADVRAVATGITEKLREVLQTEVVPVKTRWRHYVQTGTFPATDPEVRGCIAGIGMGARTIGWYRPHSGDDPMAIASLAQRGASKNPTQVHDSADRQGISAGARASINAALPDVTIRLP